MQIVKRFTAQTTDYQQLLSTFAEGLYTEMDFRWGPGAALDTLLCCCSTAWLLAVPPAAAGADF